MKRILIIGASRLQLPAIKRAKEMGLYVGTLDINRNAVGIPFADRFFHVSTVDEKAVCSTARIFGADGVITLATDAPMRAVAYTCDQLGLIGIDYPTAIKATDKGEMIKTFEKNGIEHPWYYILEKNGNIPNCITYPCVTKPTDSAGSRGVMFVNNSDEIAKAIDYSSSNGNSGKVIIEEFLQGIEISVEVMVIEGEPQIVQLTDKLTTGAPHFVEIGHNQPTALSDSVQKSVADLAKRATRAIGINNGPAHVEIMVTADGPKMIELGARLGGDFIASHLVPLSTGVDLVGATIENSLGIKPNIEPKFSKGSAIRFFLPEDITNDVIQLESARKIVGVKEIYFSESVINKKHKISNSADRVGHIIAQGNTSELAVQICNNAIKEINI